MAAAMAACAAAAVIVKPPYVSHPLPDTCLRRRATPRPSSSICLQPREADPEPENLQFDRIVPIAP
jgi:hypothetical protein